MAGRAFGAGSGLATLLQAVPELVARARPPLADLSHEALKTLAGEGLERLDFARKSPALKGPARAALLSGWQARGLLKRVSTAPETVTAGALELSEFSRRAGLLRAALRGV
jgi:hypothetical protein